MPRKCLLVYYLASGKNKFMAMSNVKKLTIYSIVETLLMPLLGIVSLILCCYLKQDENNHKIEKAIRICLWVGFFLFVIVAGGVMSFLIIKS